MISPIGSGGEPLSNTIGDSDNHSESDDLRAVEGQPGDGANRRSSPAQHELDEMGQKTVAGTAPTAQAGRGHDSVKAFQRLVNQLSQQQQGKCDASSQPGVATPPPFLLQQHLESLSPFLAALHQQQQIQQQLFLENLGGAAQLAMIANLNNGGALAAAMQGRASNASASSGVSPDRDVTEGEEGEYDGENGDEAGYNQAPTVNDEGNGYCSALRLSANGGEPEDLSLGKEGRSRRRENSTPQGNGWSYEEQFKQLYELSEDPKRKEWLDDWLSFMHRIGKPVTRIPIMAKQVLDLFELYRLVVQHGGLVEIINKKLWREITRGLNLPNSITSAAFTLRTQYQKYLYDYECDKHNLSHISDLQAAIEGNKREGRRNPPPVQPASITSTASTSNHQHHPHNPSPVDAALPKDNERFLTPLNGVGGAVLDLAKPFGSQRRNPPPLLQPLNGFGPQQRGDDAERMNSALPFHLPFAPPSSVAAALLGVGMGATDKTFKTALATNSLGSMRIAMKEGRAGNEDCERVDSLEEMQRKQLELFQPVHQSLFQKAALEAIASRSLSAERTLMSEHAVSTKRKRKLDDDMTDARRSGDYPSRPLRSLPSAHLKIASTQSAHGSSSEDSVLVSMVGLIGTMSDSIESPPPPPLKELNGVSYEGVLFATANQPQLIPTEANQKDQQSNADATNEVPVNGHKESIESDTKAKRSASPYEKSDAADARGEESSENSGI